MAKPKRSVVITGVAHHWGKALVPLLENDPDFETIIGIDYKPLPEPFKRMEFFQIEPHHPLLAELLKVSRADTVCHLLFEDAYAPSEEIFDLNVMGTMDLLAACGAGETPRVVIMSDTRVYGAMAQNPNFLDERADFRGRYSHPYISHRVEIENTVDRFVRQNSTPETVILRFANILGYGVDTPFGRYLDAPMTPVAFGFDPMMQFTHAKDVTACLYHAVKNEVAGVFNIAGPGYLPLSQVLRLGRRTPLPFGAPFLRVGTKVFQKSPIPDSLPIPADFLKFGCVGDTARMNLDLKFVPRFSTKETVLDFFENMRLARYRPRKTRIESDPKAAEELSEYLKSKTRASDYLADLIESFNKEVGHDQ